MTLTASQINTILGTQEDAKAGVKLSLILIKTELLKLTLLYR